MLASVVHTQASGDDVDAESYPVACTNLTARLVPSTLHHPWRMRLQGQAIGTRLSLASDFTPCDWYCPNIQVRGSSVRLGSGSFLGQDPSPPIVDNYQGHVPMIYPKDYAIEGVLLAWWSWHCWFRSCRLALCSRWSASADDTTKVTRLVGILRRK
jgi:hypothetical protein